MTIQDHILELKEQRNAAILAHNYTNPDVQDIADFTGDSLELSQKAAECDAPIIVFCGVRFMAETAKILNPSAQVLLPVRDAGCPMADMVTAADLRYYKEHNPDAIVVAYINTTAETKTEVDICCTSSNAEQIINFIPHGTRILFVPDQHLGDYIRYKCDRHEDIELWPGYCPVHNKIMPWHIEEMHEQHPAAEVMVHPECRPDVEVFSDLTLSTGGMLRRLKDNPQKEWIIGTEANIIHRMKKENPDKTFYPLVPTVMCPDMREITLEHVFFCLKERDPEILLPEEVLLKAAKPIKRMLEICNG